MSKITIISSSKNWLEEQAVAQLKQISTLPGVIRAIGLPDLHPGKTPVGSTVITEQLIYPHLIGNDLGCGMSYFLTDLSKAKLKLERLVKTLEPLGSLKEIPLPEVASFNSSPLGNSLGTIGAGNHFAELQTVAKIFDEATFNKLGFIKNQIMLLIHSGSRGYGEAILDEAIKLHQAQNGLDPTSRAGQAYLAEHYAALQWASTNRALIAYRILKTLGISLEAPRLIDCPHNYLSQKKDNDQTLYFHRKGSAPADQGAVIIPGSRGTLTYLVMPKDNLETSGYSLAHGAGRKWERSMCKARLENRYTRETIRLTKLQSKVVCHDSRLLFEEAPEAYKNIDTVIQSLLDFELIEIIATFKPILTYKN